MFRIIRTCNFGGSGEQPGKDEVFVGADGNKNLEAVFYDEDEALKICEQINNNNKDQDYYFFVEKTDYKLSKFEP